jgi:hypothetical protein
MPQQPHRERRCRCHVRRDVVVATAAAAAAAAAAVVVVAAAVAAAAAVWREQVAKDAQAFLRDPMERIRTKGAVLCAGHPKESPSQFVSADAAAHGDAARASYGDTRATHGGRS